MGTVAKVGPSRSVVQGTLTEAALGLVAQADAPKTREAYQADATAILAWCQTRGLDPLQVTPETVANYVADLDEQGVAVATIGRRLAFWSRAFRENGVEVNPCRSDVVRSAMKGARKKAGPQRQAAPLTVDLLRRVMEATPPDSLRGLRDRALLAVGLATALRRSELVALNVEDIQSRGDCSGSAVTLRRSKTDQEGKGRTLWLPRTGRLTCPSKALEAWLAAAEITAGPVFRSVDRHGKVGGRLSSRSVATIVRDAAERAEFPAGQWSGHSLRAGFVTTHARRGATVYEITKQTGHSPSSPVLYRYIRDASPEQSNAAAADGWL